MSNWQKIKCKFLEVESVPKRYLYDGQHLEVSRAPEPTDINWLNLKTNTSKKWSHRSISVLIFIILIIFFTWIIMRLSEKQEEMAIADAESGQDTD